MVKMCYIVVIIFIAIISSSSQKEEMSAAAIANYNGYRGEPINIKTDKAFKITGNILVGSSDGTGEKAQLINTGSSVEVRLNQETTSLKIFGMAIGNYIFVYTRTLFYWADSVNGVAGTTVDDKNGTALEVAVLYYNTKYKSYFESLKHHDGITELRIRVNAKANKDNKKFDEFATALKKIQEPGSTDITIGSYNSWYLNFPTAAYAAYPGSLKNESTGATHNCTIDIVVILDEQISISENQFEETFLQMKDSNNNALVTKQTTTSQGDRPVTKTMDESLIVFPLQDETPLNSVTGSPDS